MYAAINSKGSTGVHIQGYLELLGGRKSQILLTKFVSNN